MVFGLGICAVGEREFFRKLKLGICIALTVYVTLLLGIRFLGTRDSAVGMGNIIGSTVKPIVNTDMIRGKGTAGKAVASVSNGFSLGIPSSTALAVDFVNCGAMRLPITKGASFAIALGRSDRVLSRIMIMNFNARGGIGLANSIKLTATGRVRTHPMTGTARTLRNLMPNLRVAAGANRLSGGVSVGVHNGNAVNSNSDKDPLVLVSNVRNSVGAIGPRSVRGVSMLGSTTTSSVCKSHTPFNIVLIAAGGNGSNGPAVGCGGDFHFGDPIGLPRVVSSCAFTGCFGRTTHGNRSGTRFSSAIVRRVLSFRTTKNAGHNNLPASNGM